MSEHESMNESGNGSEGTPVSPTPEPGRSEGDMTSAEPTRSTSPRDLAKQVWGSWPSLPSGTAPPSASPSAPASAPPLAPRRPLEPVSEAELDEAAEDELDADLLAIEDRLGGTEDRLESLMGSTRESLAALGETIRTSMQNLPSVIDGVVEGRLSTVGDALLKLADLRARLQEETTEAVESLRASFQSLEERLLASTQQRVEAAMNRLTAEVRDVRELVEQRLPTASIEGGAAGPLEQDLRARVSELPTRGDLASIRGAIGAVASTLDGELAAALERIARIEQTLAVPPSKEEVPEPPSDVDQAPEPTREPPEPPRHDPFAPPPFDLPPTPER